MTCQHCGNTIKRRDKHESEMAYRARRYCNRACMGAGTRGSRKMELRYWPTLAAYLLDTSEPAA